MKLCIKGEIKGEIKDNEKYRAGGSDIYCGNYDNKDCPFLKIAEWSKGYKYDVWQCKDINKDKQVQ